MPIVFVEILSRAETRLYKQHISDYSSKVLAPLTGCRPGQLPGSSPSPLRTYPLVVRPPSRSCT